jgi:NAD(P)-dependent dehydrogenase (short-subunit alcohol dehydrogenase family)
LEARGRDTGMRLNGKVAVVTGSAAGMGKAMALRMAQEGAAMVITDIDVKGMDGVVSEITKAGGKAVACKADVTNRSELQNLMKTTVDAFGQIDILVNNAGVSRNRPFLEMTKEDWNFVLDIDLHGVFNCTQAVAVYMMEKRYGKIINISSISGMGASAHLGANANYAAAKAGVIQLTKTFARELGPYGINVNCIAPGAIQTTFQLTTRTPEQVEEHFRVRREQSVLKRIGKPEDVANAALFLASDESSFITGHLLAVNGGRSDLM